MTNLYKNFTVCIMPICLAWFMLGCSSPAPRRTDAELSRIDSRASENFIIGSHEKAASLYLQGLNRARLMDDSIEIAEFAYNAAVCFAASGRFDDARALVREARAAASLANLQFSELDLLNARIEYRAGHPDIAATLVSDILAGKPDPQVRMEALIIKARLELDANEIEPAKQTLAAALKIAEKNSESLLMAELTGLMGRMDFSEALYIDSAAKHRREADMLRKYGKYDEMAGALARAARALAMADDNSGAATLYYRAARSFYSQSDMQSALEMIVPALESADRAGDEKIVLLLTDLFELIKSKPGFL